MDGCMDRFAGLIQYSTEKDELLVCKSNQGKDEAFMPVHQKILTHVMTLQKTKTHMHVAAVVPR